MVNLKAKPYNLSDEDILGIIDDCMGKSKTLVGKSEMLKNKMINDLSKTYDDYIDDIDRQIRIGKSEEEIKKGLRLGTLNNKIVPVMEDYINELE